jgi:hypothetical protein
MTTVTRGAEYNLLASTNIGFSLRSDLVVAYAVIHVHNSDALCLNSQPGIDLTV